MSVFPRYRHIVNPRLKHTYISLDDAGDIIVKSPEVSSEYIEKLLLKKSSWINNAREKFTQKKGKALDFSKPLELYYYGQAYPLVIEKYTKKKIILKFNENRFILQYSKYDKNMFQKHIDNFYKEKAKNLIPVLVEKWASQMELFPRKVSFRKTKRQWGSCSANNNLSFNTMMLKLPLEVIEYIVIHELAHIACKHHKKSFWKLIEKYLPDYREHIKILKSYTT